MGNAHDRNLDTNCQEDCFIALMRDYDARSGNILPRNTLLDMGMSLLNRSDQRDETAMELRSMLIDVMDQ